MAVVEQDHSRTSINIDARRDGSYRRAAVAPDGKRSGSKAGRTGLHVGMRDHRHLAGSGIENHYIVGSMA